MSATKQNNCRDSNSLNKVVWFVIGLITLQLAQVSVVSADTNTQPPIITYVHSPSNRDQQKTYYSALLHLAMQKSEEKFGKIKLQTFGTSMVRQRQINSLNSGALDVMWAMTTEQREQECLPIRIPIFKGLIGYRIMVIQGKNQSLFTPKTTLEQIKSMMALQGKAWVDTDILLANGFNVQTSDWYNSLYKSLHKGFYDYFPRSVLEPYAEMRQYPYKNLAIEQHHVLYYPTAMYYFVQKDNHALAERIEYGLNKAINDGSFDQLLYSYPAHKEALSQAKLASRIVHNLTNPFLPASAPIHDERLWHNLKTN